MSRTFTDRGRVFRCTGDFREPQEGEYWLTPKGMELRGPKGEHTNIFEDVPMVFERRVIVELLQSTLLTEELLMRVMLGEVEVTIECNSCDCDGIIGNLYTKRTNPDALNQVFFYHTGSDFIVATYHLGQDLWDWDDYDPGDARVINITEVKKHGKQSEKKKGSEEENDYPF
jgi:hypothetical protein